MKDKIKKTSTDIKNVYKNGTRLIEAAALCVVAGTAIYYNWPYNHTVTINSAIVLTAGVIIALRGAVEFYKYLAQK